MSINNRNKLNFLVAIDGSPASWCSFDAVMYLMDDQMDKITAFHVTDAKKDKKYTDESHQFHCARIEQEIESYKSKSANLDVKIVVAEKNGSARKTVVTYATDAAVDILATGVKGRKASVVVPQNILGSTADFSLREFPSTSIIAKGDFERPEKGKAVFVVGVDGSLNSRKGYETARSLMKDGDKLYVIHVKSITHDEDKMPLQFRSDVLRETYTKKLSDAGVGEFVLESAAKVAPCINQFLEKVGAHFLCIGADGMKAFAKGEPILGSVTDDLVRMTKTCTCIVSQLNEYRSSSNLANLA